MLSKLSFYGGTVANVTGVIKSLRAQFLKTGSDFTLPARIGAAGGPHFYLINTTGSSTPIKRSNGTTLITLANNSIATICSTGARWVAKVDTIGAGRVFGSSPTRVQPLGWIPTPITVTEPTDYPTYRCESAYRELLYCDTGTPTGLWMADSDITSLPLYFAYNGFCYKITDQSRSGTNPAVGTTVAIGSVTTYASCAACLSASPCPPENDPFGPTSITVKFEDLDGLGFSGSYTIPRTGAGSYTLRIDPSHGISVECVAGEWIGKMDADFTWAPGGATLWAWSKYKIAGVTDRHRPPLGEYTLFDTDQGGASLQPWFNSKFTVL